MFLSSLSQYLDRYFALSASGSSIRTEILAGLTTFMAMSYVVIVNPSILAEAGMPPTSVMVATVLCAAFSTLLMGLWARLPVALAPGIGLNSFFVVSLCLGLGLSWQNALGLVFLCGLLLLLLSWSKIRTHIVTAIPPCLRAGLVAGIGLMITVIGLKNAQIIVASPVTLVTLGDLSAPSAWLSLVGLTVAVILMIRNIHGGILIGIIVTTVLAFLLGYVKPPPSWSAVFTPVWPDWPETFGALRLLPEAASLSSSEGLQHNLVSGLALGLFVLTLTVLFDNLGTLIGVCQQAKLTDPDGHIPNSGAAMVCNALGTLAGGVMGSSPITCYIESATGVAAGGRTGLSNVVVALLFLGTLFLVPLLSLVPPFATTPALILVGILMMQALRHIRFESLEESVPAALTLIMIPLTMNIAEGLGIGLIAVVLIRAMTGKARRIHPVTLLIAACFLLHFVLS